MNFSGYYHQLYCVLIWSFIFVAAPVSAAEDGFEQDTILKDAGDFFGSGAEGLADVISRYSMNTASPMPISKAQKRVAH